MGRVKRYKKYKACDPFAKRGNNTTEADLEHDDPPELFDQKKEERRAKQRRDNNDRDYERELELDAIRYLKEEQRQLEHRAVVAPIDGKKSTETMKQFKQRLREETRKALQKQAKSMSVTAQKRKQIMKERSSKKKNKDGDDEDDPDSKEFFQAENGHVRPSDMDGPSSFPAPEPITFGETLNQLPDLNKWKSALTKRMDKKKNMASLNSAALLLASSNGVDGEENGNDGDEDEDEELNEEEQEEQERKRRRNKIPIAELMTADDSAAPTTSAKMFLSGHNQANQQRKQKQKSSAVVGHFQAQEMDKLRQQSKLAYQALKRKRLQEN